MTEIESKIGYEFKNSELLATALTHSSFANEKGHDRRYNERLEFLGDSVLSLIVSDHIFLNMRELPEGELSKLRASLVCEKSLCGFARQISLGEFLRLGRGEERGGGRERDSILADAFEALIAAIYLDGGMRSARDFVLPFVVKSEKDVISGADRSFKDYKTQLQEIVQKSREETLRYRLVSQSGPDHDKRFTVEVLLNSNAIAKGEGRSKKDAEQMAAKAALEYMGE